MSPHGAEVQPHDPSDHERDRGWGNWFFIVIVRTVGLSDELIPRLRLVGDIFTNALARKRADEALCMKEQSLRQSRESLRQTCR